MAKKTKTEMKHKVPKAQSTQKYMQIAEIKDDLVLLKDGTLRKVLIVSSINFALKNEDEQKAIINGYVQFLNTIDFPVQIVVQSRKLDIKGYLEQLGKLAKVQTNELLKIQTVEYINYISELVDLAQIMEKKFFVVIPYSPFSTKQKGFFTRLQEVLSPGRVIKLKGEKFEKYKDELNRRSGIASSGLSSLGLKVAALDTQGLIELYYQIYNPSRGNEKKLGDLRKLRVQK